MNMYNREYNVLEVTGRETVGKVGLDVHSDGVEAVDSLKSYIRL